MHLLLSPATLVRGPIFGDVYKHIPFAPHSTSLTLTLQTFARYLFLYVVYFMIHWAPASGSVVSILL
jgi:hypothetical protein